MHHKHCLDCGRTFATVDPDVALCPACFRAYIAQEEGEGPARVFDADYADGYADSWYAVAGAERRRLLTNEWPEDAPPDEHHPRAAYSRFPTAKEG